MTRQEAVRQNHQSNTLQSLGFTADEAESLRRISMTLHRWHEMECNGEVDRDEVSGDVYRCFSMGPQQGMRHYKVADRETGARNRLQRIISDRNQRVIAATPQPETIREHLANALNHSVSTYIQTDPRGAALYIIRPGDIPEGSSVESCYSRGICVY
jgi:hypothetical protein